MSRTDNADMEARIAALEKINGQQQAAIESLNAAARVARPSHGSTPSFGDLDERYYAWRDEQLERVLNGEQPYSFSFTKLRVLNGEQPYSFLFPKPRDDTDRSAGRD